jgi:hypothetical protein
MISAFQKSETKNGRDLVVTNCIYFLIKHDFRFSKSGTKNGNIF